MRKLGILQLTKSSGAAAYTYELAEGIIASCPSVEIVAYLSDGNVRLDKWRKLGVTVHTYSMYTGVASGLRSSVMTQNWRAVAKQINTDAPDLILETAASIFWSTFIKRRLHSSIQTADIIHDPDPHPDRWSLAVKLHRKFFHFEPNVLVGFSEFAARRLKQLFPSRQIVVSRHGAYQRPANFDLDSQVEQLVHNRHRFLFFGRIEQYKGVEQLIDAYQIAKPAAPDLVLTIAGNGPLHQDYYEKIEHLGIRFINRWIEDSEMTELFATHGVLVLPYVSATQSGPAAIALARAMPCVATDVGALPEQVQHGVSGLIVKHADAQSLADGLVEMTKTSNEQFGAMAVAAHKLASTEFSWTEIGRQLIEDLDAILEV